MSEAPGNADGSSLRLAQGRIPQCSDVVTAQFERAKDPDPVWRTGPFRTGPRLCPHAEGSVQVLEKPAFSKSGATKDERILRTPLALPRWRPSRAGLFSHPWSAAGRRRLRRPQSGGADGSRRKALPRIGRHVAAAATVQQRHSCLSDGDVGQTRRHHPLVHKVRKVVCKSDRAWRRCPWMFFSRKALFNSLLEAFPGLRLWDGHGSAPGRLAGERIGAAPRRPHPGRARIGEPGDTACHRPGCHRSTPCTGE